MSHVTELRRVTTQERLRSDHISMMEMLEASATENASLKSEIAKLKQQVACSDAVAPEGSKEDSAAPRTESMANMVQRILAQESSIKDLKEEVKVLTGKLASSSLEIRNLKKSHSSNDALRRDLDAMLAAQKHREQEDAASAAAMAELRAKTDDRAALEKAFSSLKLEHDALKDDTHTSQSALRSRIAELENQSQAMAHELLNAQSDITVKAVRIGTLELALREMSRVRTDTEDSWRDKYHSESLAMEGVKSELCRVQSELLESRDREAALQADLSRRAHDRATAASAGIKPNALIDIAEPPPSPQPKPQPKPQPQPQEQPGAFFLTGAEAPPQGVANQQGPSGGLFEEFIRLRRENKQLKLELAAGGKGAALGSGPGVIQVVSAHVNPATSGGVGAKPGRKSSSRA